MKIIDGVYNKIRNNYDLSYLWIFLIVTIYSFLVLKYQLSMYHNFNLNYDFSNFTCDTVVKFAGGSDIASYISGAKHFLKNHDLQFWTFNLWPAGLQLLLSCFLTVFGDKYYPVAWFLFINVMWTIVLKKIFYVFRKEGSSLLYSFLFTFAPILFCSFSITFLGWIVYYSEGISAPFFVLLMAEFFQWIKTRKLKNIVSVAFCFSIIANARSLFFNISILWFLGLISLLLLIHLLSCLKKYLKENEFFDVIQFFNVVFQKNHNCDLKKDLKNVCMAFFIMIVIFSPWVARNIVCKNPWAWNYSGFVWVGNWWPKENWPGMNTAYQVNPKLGEFLNSTTLKKNNSPYFPPELGIVFYRNMTISEFLTNPVKWYKVKSRRFYQYFWNSTNLAFGIKGNTPNDLFAIIRLENKLFIVLLLSITFYEIYKLLKMILCKNSLLNSGDKMYVLLKTYFWLAILLLHIAVFTFAHFEVRYSIFLKLMSSYYFFRLLVNYKKSVVSESNDTL